MSQVTLQVASDLHLEGYRGHLPDETAFRAAPDRDVLILAGDIGVGGYMALPFIDRELARSPVIYVPGNHEYYTRQLRDSVDRAWHQAAADRPGLHYLTGQGLTLDGVRFWGAPWYSDLGGVSPRSAEGARLYRHIDRSVSDFYDGWAWGVGWTVAAHVNAHHVQSAKLLAHAGELDAVITHWPPTWGAIHPRFKNDSLNPYFYNNKPDMVGQVGAKVWVAGHTHDAFDYMEGETRCIGNPAGYRGEVRGHDSPFRADRTVTVNA